MLGGAAMKLTMAVRFNVADDGPDAHGDLESFFDRVMEELLRLDAAEHSTISASLAKKNSHHHGDHRRALPGGAPAIGMSAIRQRSMLPERPRQAGRLAPGWRAAGSPATLRLESGCLASSAARCIS
jgi:hypothetical protein